MRGKLRFAALFLAAGAMFAQHGGRAGGGTVASFSHAAMRAAVPGAGRQNRDFLRRRGASRPWFGNGFFSPYYPYLDYPYLGDYSDGFAPEADYVPFTNYGPEQPGPMSMVQPAPIQTAHPVIENYSWPNQPTSGASDQTTFTIVLKDGSTRTATATWVQGRMLHYTDADDSQGAIPSDRIDRDATRRANKDKGLSVQLPPR